MRGFFVIVVWRGLQAKVYIVGSLTVAEGRSFYFCRNFHFLSFYTKAICSEW